MPGDLINNLSLSIFDDASTCNQIDEYHTLQKPLISKCKSESSFNKFCPLYCTKRKTFGIPGYDYIYYKGKRKLKIKACSGYFLKDLFDNLKKSLSKINIEDYDKISPKLDKPILLIPFTCNAKQNSKSNGFDLENHTHLTDIYHKLYDERYNTKVNKKVLDKKVLKKSSTKKTIKKCKNFKKYKDPKCNEQEGCQWMVNKGCLDK